jgi:hypothetical protein
MRTLLVAALLAGCAAGSSSVPPPNILTDDLPQAPLALRRCLPAVPPPRVPPVPRTLEQLADYAWAEASARWRTADRLEDCRRQMDRVLDWIAEHRKSEETKTAATP